MMAIVLFENKWMSPNIYLDQDVFQAAAVDRGGGVVDRDDDATCCTYYSQVVSSVKIIYLYRQIVSLISYPLFILFMDFALLFNEFQWIYKLTIVPLRWR